MHFVVIIAAQQTLCYCYAVTFLVKKCIGAKSSRAGSTAGKIGCN